MFIEAVRDQATESLCRACMRRRCRVPEISPQRRRDARQCTPGANPGFVVHGLWPQYERGFPRDCQVPAPRLNRNIMTSMLDLMPAPGLIFNEWDKHGTCSGLAPGQASSLNT